jgi:hypothetical protein
VWLQCFGYNDHPMVTKVTVILGLGHLLLLCSRSKPLVVARVIRCNDRVGRNPGPGRRLFLASRVIAVWYICMYVLVQYTEKNAAFTVVLVIASCQNHGVGTILQTVTQSGILSLAKYYFILAEERRKLLLLFYFLLLVP